jgi:diguanylate cyclase (GGDEF)-like protein
MALRPNLITRVFRASIQNKRELTSYVVCVTAVCVAVALAVDVVNQLTFFVDWMTCLRSWGITILLVLALAIPIARTIGNAHLKLYQAKLLAEELSRTDQLTGLPNRRALMEAVYTAKLEALALVIVDIDRFKRVNDTHGHLAGDAVIRSVGQMMATDFSALGHVARVGGEEFALLSSGVSPESLMATLAAFCEKVKSTPVLTNGLAVRVTISAGVALRQQNETFDQLYSAADRALYAAKAAGRNRVRFSDEIDRPRDRDAIEPSGLNPGQFSLSA